MPQESPNWQIEANESEAPGLPATHSWSFAFVNLAVATYYDFYCLGPLLFDFGAAMGTVEI